MPITGGPILCSSPLNFPCGQRKPTSFRRMLTNHIDDKPLEVKKANCLTTSMAPKGTHTQIHFMAYMFFCMQLCQVCVGTRKRAIHIVMITEDSIYPTREISVSEPPLHLVSHLITQSLSSNASSARLYVTVAGPG